MVLVLSILENLCLHLDFKCACISGVSVVHSGGPCVYPVILNVHVLVVLALSTLEDLCLPRDFKCTCISGVSLAHSGEPVFTL